MARLFRGPLNSPRNINAFIASLDNFLYNLNNGTRQPSNNNSFSSQAFIYFDSTTLEDTCAEMDCEGCECPYDTEALRFTIDENIP